LTKKHKFGTSASSRQSPRQNTNLIFVKRLTKSTNRTLFAPGHQLLWLRWATSQRCSTAATALSVSSLTVRQFSAMFTLLKFTNPHFKLFQIGVKLPNPLIYLICTSFRAQFVAGNFSFNSLFRNVRLEDSRFVDVGLH